MATSSSTAASTSASANTTSNSPFDVFINHRGPDVKKTFASYLYRRLSSYGLKVFLDQEELQQGDYLTSQIEGAIQTASVHVAIFSAGYADSTWCLNELLKMLESKGTVIPVFYHVKPGDLRWTQNKDKGYGKALWILEEKRNADEVTLRHDPATVEKWRKALSDISLISGFELEACNGNEGVLLEKVVASVLRKVKKTPLDVAKYPTGLDEKVRDFENKILLQHQQHSGIKAQVVGIVGFGGVGKTTLAKKVFNKKSSDYKISCFLDDVRENVKNGSLISLQSNLLRRLTGSDLLISNKDEGTEMLRKHLSSQQILLILDDVDSVDQVDALLPNQHFIHSNSLILITSRDRDILTRSGVENASIYKLDGLSQQHSLELFCSHAFSRPDPLSGFEILAGDFLEVCDGLPLSLKVIGALLHGKNDVSYWENQLCKLKKTLPHEIQERLKISYDALDGEEKQIFLDIACFFRGHDTDMAIRIWDASGWQGRFGFENLQNKCLVEVVSSPDEYSYGGSVSNKIHMHDHLRDLGRSESLVTKPLRFCHIDELLEQSSVITVRGIRMVLSEDHDDDEFDDEFEGIQMRKLQLVDTEYFLSESILKRVKLPNLIWLCWKECPYSSLPRWIPMKNLRVLQVSGSRLETLWELESQAPLQLPVRLEELRVDGCWRLKSIRGLEQATKLRLIDVGGCSELEELRAEGCARLKSIRGLEQATKLRLIHVPHCSELEELPCMETWASLEELRADGCKRLKSIRGLEQATKLRLIDVCRCSELEELPCMGTWASLEELSAEQCARLKSIRGLEQATKLRLINVRWCSDLEELPCMETWASLEELWAEGCARLKSIRGLEQATKLRLMYVRMCSELEELPCMETWASLEELCARGCARLKSIRGLEQATKLRVIDVRGCSELEELPCMGTWASLEALLAGGCARLKSIRGLEQATKLRLIDVDGCSELEELPCMETWESLKGLWAERCTKLKSIRGLLQCTELRTLSVKWCCELEEVEGVEHCTWLEELDVYGCHKLQCTV